MAAAAFPLLLGGTALQLHGQRQAAKERRNILNAQLERDARTSQKATDAVLKEAGTLSPAARQAAMDEQAGAILTQSQSDLAGAGGGLIDTAGSAGNVSPDFLKAQADRQISEGGRLTSIARALATTRAPSDLLSREAQRRANLSGDLQSAFNSNRRMAEAAQQDAQDVEVPLYGQLGSVASALGSGLMLSGAGPSLSGMKTPGFSGTQSPAPIINRNIGF